MASDADRDAAIEAFVEALASLLEADRGGTASVTHRASVAVARARVEPLVDARQYGEAVFRAFLCGSGGGMNVARRWVAPTHSYSVLTCFSTSRASRPRQPAGKAMSQTMDVPPSSSFGPSVAPLAQTSETKNYRVERHECMPPRSIPHGKKPRATGPGLPRRLLRG